MGRVVAYVVVETVQVGEVEGRVGTEVETCRGADAGEEVGALGPGGVVGVGSGGFGVFLKHAFFPVANASQFLHVEHFDQVLELLLFVGFFGTFLAVAGVVVFALETSEGSGDGFELGAFFHGAADVELRSHEVAHFAGVVVEGGVHEEVEEGGAIAAADRFVSCWNQKLKGKQCGFVTY